MGEAKRRNGGANGGGPNKPESLLEEGLRGKHVYVLRDGDHSKPKNFLFTRCAEEVYCQAELLLLAKKAPINDALIIGVYLVDPTLSVAGFLKSYRETGRMQEIEAMVAQVKATGFNFKTVQEMADMEDKIVALVPGPEQPESTPAQYAERQASLKATIAHYLPQFVEGVQAASEKKVETGEKAPMMILHQDAFAAGYHQDEYVLLGMAIKYAGLHGVDVIFHGKNHETF